MKPLIATLAAGLAATSSLASVVTRDVDYEHDGVKLRGFLAYDDAKTKGAKPPGILIVHEWWGLNDYVKGRAVQLAKMGYVAFALDMYGKGVVATDPQTAGGLAGQFYGKPLMAQRAQAGLDQLLATGLADPARIAAIGYCFGGSTVQALAYSGAPLVGIVSFHGGLIPATPESAARNKAKFLICNGGIDPSVKPEQLDAYLKSLNDTKIDYRFVQYAGALHAFTNPGVDAIAQANPGMRGFVGYSPSADRRSWEDMKAFFAELFVSSGS
jgi:dienelactone hydrolase